MGIIALITQQSIAAAIALLIGVSSAPSPAASKPRPWVLAGFLVVRSVSIKLALPYLHQSLRVAAETSTSTEQSELSAEAEMVNALTGAGIKKRSLVVRGTVEDHCHLLGCWLLLRDRTGKLFVELASSGLNARALPDGSRVQLTGHIGTTCEGKTGFIASNIKVLR